VLGFTVHREEVLEGHCWRKTLGYGGAWEDLRGYCEGGGASALIEGAVDGGTALLEERGACLRAFSFLINLDTSAKIAEPARPPWNEGDALLPRVEQERSQRSASRGRGTGSRAEVGERAGETTSKSSTTLPKAGKPPPHSAEGRPRGSSVGQARDDEAASAAEAARDSQAAESKRQIHRLRQEIDEITAMHAEVLAEQQSETLDSRRVLLLKSQNAQLQRQCNIFSSALERRRELVTHCEHILETAHDVLKNESYSPAVASQTAKKISQALLSLRRSSVECDKAPLLFLFSFLRDTRKI